MGHRVLTVDLSGNLHPLGLPGTLGTQAVGLETVCFVSDMKNGICAERGQGGS